MRRVVLEQLSRAKEFGLLLCLIWPFSSGFGVGWRRPATPDRAVPKPLPNSTDRGPDRRVATALFLLPAVFEPEAVPVYLRDVDMLGQPIQQGRSGSETRT